MDKDVKSEKEKQLRICVITYPFSKRTRVYNLLFDLLEILKPICDRLYIITGNIPEEEVADKKMQLINLKVEKELRRDIPLWLSLPRWFFNYMLAQIKMSWSLFRISSSIDTVIFFLGTNYPLPAILARILRKKVVTIATISTSQAGEVTYPSTFIFVISLIEKFVYTLSHRIIVDSENIHRLGLDRYRNKIAYRARHVNLTIFNIARKIEERVDIVGFIGRFSTEKGVINFIEAIPIILKKRSNIGFLIGGGGPLYGLIKQKLETYHSDKIILLGWIPHEELSKNLNKLKLIVIPSYTETGPFIALEAMACGTPILSTRVGLIPSIIKDGETGFILENNSPECIAENVIRALEHPDLDGIVKNARKIIEDKYTYEAAVERYRAILQNF